MRTKLGIKKRDARNRMRNQEWQVDDRGQHGAAPKTSPGQKPGDWRAREYTDRHRAKRSDEREPKCAAHLGIAERPPHAARSCPADEAEHRADQDQQEE